MHIEAVICWKWTPKADYRSTYGPETVHTLRDMVRRHYPYPHRFICVTDDPTGLDAGVEVLPDFGDFLDVPSPAGARNPSCYRRLRLYHPDAAQWFSRRFVSLDIDTVITGPLAPVWDRPEDFVMWAGQTRNTHYNGSMVLMTAGARAQVWTTFDPLRSPPRAAAAGHYGSDQAWISCCLGPGEPTFTREDGVYSFRNDLAKDRHRPLPANARIVFFHGQRDPWQPDVQALYPWVREHYRAAA